MLQRNILCFEDINIVKLFLNVTQKQTFLQFLFTLTTSHHSGYPLSLIHILAIAAHHHSIRARVVMLASACSSSPLAPHSLFVFPRRRTFFVRRLLLCSSVVSGAQQQHRSLTHLARATLAGSVSVLFCCCLGRVVVSGGAYSFSSLIIFRIV